MTKDNVAFFAALVAASATILVTTLTISSGYLAEKRLRRRTLFGEAYKSAMAWLELVGRVRRRDAGRKAEVDLIERFHSLQEEILYHRGWIGSESVYMQRSYDLLVREVKRRSSLMIQEAWVAQPMDIPSASLAASRFPDASGPADRFLRDVRRHLSPWVLPRLLVAVAHRSRRVAS